jgi:FKBP-type peptidyl-prolyl cis-trans isomerase
LKTPIPCILSLVLSAALAAPAGAADKPAAPPKDSAGFPDQSYASLGSSMGQSSHFGELGWTDEQVGAFLDGMRQAFHGQAPAMDDSGHRLSAEVSARISDIDAGKPGKVQGTYPLSAFTAFGASIELGGHFGELSWSDEQFEALVEGMRSAFRNKPYEVDDSARQLADMMARKISQLDSSAEQRVAPAFEQGRLVPFMKEAAKKYHLQMSDTGLGYNITAGRNGIRPRPGDTVVVSCRAVAYDGTTQLPQLSSDRVRSPLDQMFPGFREGLQMMTPDSHAIFVLPPALSFGHGQWPEGVQPGSPLIFEVTLMEVQPAKEPPAK